MTTDRTWRSFLKLVRTTDSLEGRTFLARWESLLPADKWPEYLGRPVVPEDVVAMAHEAAEFFLQQSALLHDDERLEELRRQGHAFLEFIQAQAQTVGLNVSSAEIDSPLTMPEALAARVRLPVDSL